jgi:hypothetical protein
MIEVPVPALVHPVVLAGLLLAGPGCAPEPKDSKEDLIDSLITRVEEIQAEIGSPEIQRINDHIETIRSDITLLAGRGYDTSINQQMIWTYRSLDNELNSCLRSCSRYHEEAFMIESSLKEIRSMLGRRQADPAAMETRLQIEKELLADLKRRVDSTRLSVELRVRAYYRLKPGIDSLITQPGNQAATDE